MPLASKRCQMSLKELARAVDSSERRIHFRVPDTLVDSFDAKRRAEGRTRASALRQLVEDYVGQEVSAVVDNRRLGAVDKGPNRAVFFRLNPREVALAKSAADNFGGITAWAAGLVRSRLGTKSALVAEPERAALIESTAQLKRIGINLNQIAFRLNRDERHEVTAVERDEIQEACRQVKIHSAAVDRLVHEVKSRGEGGDGKG